MTIKEYINDGKSTFINGIRCVLFGVNYNEDLDIEKKTLFDNDPERAEWFSFLERLDKAKEELTNDIKNKSLDEAKNYYKSMTENGNQYYWGGMIWVLTDSIDTDNAIYYGIRMD